jgi:hypothetical protein
MDTTSQWLKENGLMLSEVPADGPAPASSAQIECPSGSTVADLDLVDPEEDENDDAVDGTSSDRPCATVYQRDPSDRWENTERVDAAFRAAGNPKFQDIRFKSAKISHCPGPTHREISVERAQRLSRSVSW